MADPFQDDQDTGEGRSDDSTAPVSPASAELSPTESHGGNTHGPAALPGAVATVWSSILSTAHRRLGKGR
jgi:hypothetical protein